MNNQFTNELENENGFENELCNGNEEQKFGGNELQNSLKKNRGNELHSKDLTPKSSTINTPWGLANVVSTGYYAITSTREGNCGKLLHRLIFEDYHKCTLLRQGIIHHIDRDKLNNSIDNLELVSLAEHNRKHKTRHRDNYWNMEDYWDLSNKLSEQKNTTGYLHVYKQVCSRCKQGFTYKYTWREHGKRKTLESIDIHKLEEKVKAKKLPWKKL